MQGVLEKRPTIAIIFGAKGTTLALETGMFKPASVMTAAPSWCAYSSESV